MSSDGSDGHEERLMADELPDAQGVEKYENELAKETGVVRNINQTEGSTDAMSEQDFMG